MLDGSTLSFYYDEYFFLRFFNSRTDTYDLKWYLPPAMNDEMNKLLAACREPIEQACESRLPINKRQSLSDSPSLMQTSNNIISCWHWRPSASRFPYIHSILNFIDRQCPLAQTRRDSDSHERKSQCWCVTMTSNPYRSYESLRWLCLVALTETHRFLSTSSCAYLWRTRPPLGESGIRAAAHQSRSNSSL